ncbi:MAG: DUF4893 domain-containing protein [Phenylobacterium sp.]|nr:DUF4893 domain-containing protein [Phenylobacterium sp.]
MSRPLGAAVVALSIVAGTSVGHARTCEASDADVDRLERLSEAWSESLSEARRSGAVPALRRARAAVRETVSLDRPHPTPGHYQCRTFKLGSHDGLTPFIAYGWFRCSVELTPGGDLILTKHSGSQRQDGLICPGPAGTLQFVGTMAWGDERGYPTYGADRDRDLIGRVERIGDDRWRVAFPWPRHESKLDILELRRVR